MRALATLFAALLCLALPSAAEASSKTLRVGDTAVQWSTPSSYGDKDAPTIWLKYKGRDIVGNQVKAGCVIDFAGYGLTARVWACDNGKGHRAPIRVRVANSRGDMVKVHFVWKVL